MSKPALRTGYGWLFAGFMVSFLVVGLPYWNTPYDKASSPSTLYGLGLLVVGGLAALVRCAGKVRFWLAIVGIGAAVPATVLIRIAVETAKDPTSHNLWPIEVFLATAVGMASSLMGTLAGSALPPQRLHLA
jgi:hypothetical protein